MTAEELFLKKYGNKITASESWVIRFAEEYGSLKASEVANKNFGNVPVISCACPKEDKHGETKIWCCNHCGLSTEDWWGKH